MRSAARATPKSMTRGPSGATSTLDGLRSRCTRPTPWIDSSASAHPAASHRTAPTGSGPHALTSRASDGAGTYAVASQGRSASGSASTTAAVKNPLTRRAAATSCANRVRNPASSARSTLIVFTATSRPAAERPRYTWPIAPAPRRPRITYGPIRSGSHRRSGASPSLTPDCGSVMSLLTPTLSEPAVSFHNAESQLVNARSRLGLLRVGGKRNHGPFGPKMFLAGGTGSQDADRDHRIAERAGGGEARLDDRVDQVQPFVEPGERALHRVDGQPLDVRPAVPELRDQPVEFGAERDLAHQPVVGVHRDPELQLAQDPDRVLGDRPRGAGLHVGGRAHLQRDPAVPDVGGQPAEPDGPLRADLDVVHDADAVAEALGAAPLHRLPDRRQPERLARVDRDVEVLPLQVLERVQVPARRPARLGARDVEADHALIAVADGQLGDLQRPGRRAHRGEQGVHRDPAPFATLPEALENRLDHLVQAQPAFGVQLRHEPDLGVDHAVGGQVRGAFGRDPAQRVRGLHDRDRVPERVQVDLEVAAVRAFGQPAGQLLDVVAGQVAVADLVGQLEYGLRAQAAVQMIVQQDLRDSPDLIKGEHLPIVLCGSDVLDDRGRGFRGRCFADFYGAVERGQGGRETVFVVGAQFEQGLAFLYFVARLGQADHARGGADRVLLTGPARAEAPGRGPDLEGVEAGQPAVGGRRAGFLDIWRLGQRGVRIAALGADHFFIGSQGPAVGYGRGRVFVDACEGEHLAGQG